MKEIGHITIASCKNNTNLFGLLASGYYTLGKIGGYVSESVGELNAPMIGSYGSGDGKTCYVRENEGICGFPFDDSGDRIRI